MSRPWPPPRVCKYADCEMHGKEQRGDYESVEGVVLCGRCMRPIFAPTPSKGGEQ